MLPGLVENLDVFELHADAGPELHGIRGVVFAASLYRTICMCPNKKNIRKIKTLKRNRSPVTVESKYGTTPSNTGFGIIHPIPERQQLAKLTYDLWLQKLLSIIRFFFYW